MANELFCKFSQLILWLLKPTFQPFDIKAAVSYRRLKNPNRYESNQ